MATPLNRGACAKSDTEAMTNTNATIIFFIFDVFTTGRQNYTIFHFPTLVGTKLPPFLLLHHQTSSEQSHLLRPRIVWSLREARRNSPLFVFVLNELDTHAFDHTIVHRKKREARLLTLAHKSVHRSLFQDGIDKKDDMQQRNAFMLVECVSLFPQYRDNDWNGYEHGVRNSSGKRARSPKKRRKKPL